MKKMRVLKKVFAWVLVCAMLVALAPASSLTAAEEETVFAINEGETQDGNGNDSSVVVIDETQDDNSEKNVQEVSEDTQEKEPAVLEEEEPVDFEFDQPMYETDEEENTEAEKKANEVRPVTKAAVKADTNPNPPETSKKVTKNPDGTYKITLDIKGKVQSETTETKANVIIVLDISGSMKENAGGGQTRLQSAKNAVNSVADTLLGLNGATTESGTVNPNDLVEMALVTFSTNASEKINTTDLASFKRSVNGISADGGTNWEAALKKAQGVNFGDNDDTFIIFVSDGNPTFRDTKGNYGYLPVMDNDQWHNWQGTPNNYYNRYRNDDIYYSDDGVYGLGSDDPEARNYSLTSMQRCYDNAVDEAQSISSSNKGNFYGIGIYGNAAWVSNLVKDANGSTEKYYNANQTSDLNNALAEIASAVTDFLKQSNVSTTDGVTNLSNLEAKVIGEASGFEYFIKSSTADDFSTWDEAPDAEYNAEKGGVVWDLSEKGGLEDGTTYRVTFDVWPSQAAYDQVADLNNGLADYDTLDQSIKDQIIENTDGSYALKTNTVLYTDYTYQGSDYTQNYTFTQEPMTLYTETISVKKLWQDLIDDYSQMPDSIDLILQKDGKDYLAGANAISLTQDGQWKHDDIYIAPGFMRTDPHTHELTVLETGHDYALVEAPSDAYHWELTAATYHPMVINGVLTLLKADEDGEYTIGGKKYTETTAAETTLEATNHRRSNLNLTKVVTDTTEGLAPADAKFKYSITITNSNASSGYDADKEVWFSVWDGSGYVMDLETEAEPEYKDGAQTGYFIANSGEAFTVMLQAGWNLRVINMASGSEYTIVETEMPGGFVFNTADSTTTTKTIDLETRTVSGVIDEPNKNYQVTYTNEYDGFFYVYHTSMTGDDEGVIEAFEISDYKTQKFNIYELTAENTYYGGYYNNYYYKGEINIEDAPNPKVKKGTGTKYLGQLLGFYSSKAKAYTDEKGTAMTPKAGTVYFLKEVPLEYLNEKVYVRYFIEGHPQAGQLNAIEPITCIDDKNYQERGFYFGDETIESNRKKVDGLSSVFVETKGNEETRRYTGKSEELFSTPNNGYLVIDDYKQLLSDNLNTTKKLTAYWITPDGITVKSVHPKKIVIGDELKYGKIQVVNAE